MWAFFNAWFKDTDMRLVLYLGSVEKYTYFIASASVKRQIFKKEINVRADHPVVNVYGSNLALHKIFVSLGKSLGLGIEKWHYKGGS